MSWALCMTSLWISAWMGRWAISSNICYSALVFILVYQRQGAHLGTGYIALRLLCFTKIDMAQDRQVLLGNSATLSLRNTAGAATGSLPLLRHLITSAKIHICFQSSSQTPMTLGSMNLKSKLPLQWWNLYVLLINILHRPLNALGPSGSSYHSINQRRGQIRTADF